MVEFCFLQFVSEPLVVVVDAAVIHADAGVPLGVEEALAANTDDGHVENLGFKLASF